jgi:orotidine-5'-phosphate decarboxylase
MPYSPPDDQGRTLPPGEAVLNGVKYLVIGRPIRNPEGGRTRQEVIEEIRMDIANALAGRMVPPNEDCWVVH